MTITWTAATRGLLARAAACLAINRAAGFTDADARTMTLINLMEANGFLDAVGPVRRDPVTKQPYVGNDNGTVDVSAWMLNKAAEGLSPVTYAGLALVLHRTRGWAPWYAWKNRAKNKDLALFEAIVDEAARVLTLPASWAEAAKHRKP